MELVHCCSVLMHKRLFGLYKKEHKVKPIKIMKNNRLPHNTYLSMELKLVTDTCTIRKDNKCPIQMHK